MNLKKKSRNYFFFMTYHMPAGDYRQVRALRSPKRGPSKKQNPGHIEKASKSFRDPPMIGTLYLAGTKHGTQITCTTRVSILSQHHTFGPIFCVSTGTRVTLNDPVRDFLAAHEHMCWKKLHALLLQGLTQRSLLLLHLPSVCYSSYDCPQGAKRRTMRWVTWLAM